jgi:glycosyltransferase involved in cell wall biosynthesis
MRRLQAELGDRVVLDLVGFFDDDYKAEVQELVDSGIAVFHGFQSEPRPYYASADCVVLPSYHEGMSNVLLEAAATCRPVITSRIHGCMEAVEDGKTGLLCTVKDTDSLYEAMLQMANLSADARAEMGIAARQKIEREFEKSGVVQRTIRAVLD